MQDKLEFLMVVSKDCKHSVAYSDGDKHTFYIQKTELSKFEQPVEGIKVTVERIVKQG
jgi:hypothetical protein